MKNERELQARCLKLARSLNVWARKMETPAYNGFPDCMFIYKSRFMLIEFKSPSGRGALSPLQVKDHERLMDVGVHVKVIDSRRTFETLLNEFIQGVI